MTRSTLPAAAKLLNYYYAATIVFVLLDYLLHINIRVAFLQDWPAWRAFYYIFCFACFGLMMWRPGWSTEPGLFMNALAPLLDLCLHTKSSSLGNTPSIPLGRKIPRVNKSLCNHRGDS